LMPAPLQAMPAPMLPTSMPGDGVMGLGELSQQCGWSLHNGMR
jgi:hypothetical protein